MNSEGSAATPRVEEQILRVTRGRPIPDGWEFVRWLGTETGIEYGPSWSADVILARRVSGASSAGGGT